MKILLVTDTLHAGGAETFVLRLAKKLNEFGFDADILSLNPDIEDTLLIKPYESICIHRVKLPFLRWIKRLDRLFHYMGLDYSFQQVLNKRVIVKMFLERYDIFHTHLMPVDFLFAQIKMKCPALKVVSTLHGDYNDYEFQWQQKKVYRKLHWPLKVSAVIRQIDSWVYISKQQRELFQEQYEVPSDKLHHIYNGYEPVVPFPVPAHHAGERKGLTFIMVARGIKEKGWEFLIKAFLRLTGEHRLVLVGKGNFLDQLKAAYGSNKNIEFTGLHPNPASLIANADVFVFPSIYKAESLPTVVIESLYCGVPVISTDIGNVKEMLMHPVEGLAGILINGSDENVIVDQLKKAMTCYITDRVLLNQHKERTKAAFEKFEMATCCNNYISLYQNVLSS